MRILPKKLILILITIFCLVGLSYFGNLTLAANLGDAFFEDFLGKSAQEAGYDPDEREIETTISSIVQTVLSFLGVIFLILMIYGGYLWMTARGNEEQTTKAKNTITAAIIGIVIVLSAYAISYLVIKKLGDKALDSSSSAETETE